MSTITEIFVLAIITLLFSFIDYETRDKRKRVSILLMLIYIVVLIAIMRGWR